MVKKNLMVVVFLALLSYAESVEKNTVHSVILSTNESQAETVQLPDDVANLLVKMKECSYWIDEWSPDVESEQRAKIEDNINKICLEVIEQRKGLIDKYQDKTKILEHLN